MAMSNDITGNIEDDERLIVEAAKDFIRHCDIRYPYTDAAMIALRRFANAIRIECLRDAMKIIPATDDPQLEPTISETGYERDKRQALAEDAADQRREELRETQS